MTVATGPKVRKIKAIDVKDMNSFEFNKSINPRGGVAGRMDLSSTGQGHRLIKIFQDLNNDGKVAKKELIYKGKCKQEFSKDELVDFNGNVKLRKEMHMCNWMMMKKPTKLTGCTREFIPTTFDLSLITSNDDTYRFEPVGTFSDSSVLFG